MRKYIDKIKENHSSGTIVTIMVKFEYQLANLKIFKN